MKTYQVYLTPDTFIEVRAEKIVYMGTGIELMGENGDIVASFKEYLCYVIF